MSVQQSAVRSNQCLEWLNGTLLAGEGDSVMGTVTLHPASDFVCVGAAFVHHAQNVEQYSDHGQSVTSSLEYCNGKNVSNIQL